MDETASQGCTALVPTRVSDLSRTHRVIAIRPIVPDSNLTSVEMVCMHVNRSNLLNARQNQSDLRCDRLVELELQVVALEACERLVKKVARSVRHGRL